MASETDESKVRMMLEDYFKVKNKLFKEESRVNIFFFKMKQSTLCHHYQFFIP